MHLLLQMDIRCYAADLSSPALSSVLLELLKKRRDEQMDDAQR